MQTYVDTLKPLYPTLGIGMVAESPPHATPNRRPEYVDYHDDGCKYHDSCLTCPFAVCKFDLPRGTNLDVWLRQEQRKALMRPLLKQELSDSEIASRLGCDRTTISRLRRRIGKAD